MPSKYTSPYATSFKSAIKRGTSYTTAVESIAKRCKKTQATVWESLFKAGWCYRQKFNGQWFYWPKEVGKFSAATRKTSQYNMWQWFAEWCITSGYFTPQQFHKHCGSQKEFMTWCRKFWGKQYTWTTTKRTTTKRRTARRATTQRKSTRRTTSKSYAFPKSKSRRYRRAA